MSTRTKILAAVAALALLVIVLARGGEPSPQRQALEDDPMASYVPPGGTLVNTTSENEGTSAGVYTDATFTREFQLPSGRGNEAVRDARAAAKAAGWVVGTSGAKVFDASKRVASGRVVLHVALLENPHLLPKGTKPPVLIVLLRHPAP